MGWHQSNLGFAAGLHRWGKAAETHPNQLPAVRSATWQSERPATHSAAQGRRGCAARLQLVAGAPRPSPRARARLARGPMGGQGTGHLQAVGSLISSVRPEPIPLRLSSLFSTSFPCPVCPVSVSLLIPYYPLPTPGARDPSTTSQRLDSTSPLSNGRTHQSNLDSPTRPPIPIAPRRPRNHRLWIDAPHSAPWR